MFVANLILITLLPAHALLQLQQHLWSPARLPPHDLCPLLDRLALTRAVTPVREIPRPPDQTDASPPHQSRTGTTS